MNLSFGSLSFQENDILNIEDEAGKTSLVAERKRNCEKCYFSGICDKSNPGNFMARFCKETHFVEKKSRKTYDKK